MSGTELDSSFGQDKPCVETSTQLNGKEISLLEGLCSPASPTEFSTVLNIPVKSFS